MSRLDNQVYDFEDSRLRNALLHLRICDGHRRQARAITPIRPQGLRESVAPLSVDGHTFRGAYAGGIAEAGIQRCYSYFVGFRGIKSVIFGR